MRLLAFEHRWFRAAYGALFPRGASPDLPLGAEDVSIEPLLDDIFRYAPRRAALGFRAAIWVIQLAPLLLLMSWRPLSRLPFAERVTVLEKLAKHPVYPLRELTMILKTLGCMGYLGLPVVQRQLGVEDIDPTPPAWAREEPGS